jgi:hypothetical protein
MSNQQTKVRLTETLFDWLVKNHVSIRLTALTVGIAALIVGGELDAPVVKWTCFIVAVPLLTAAQLNFDTWRVFHKKSHDDTDR